MTTRTGSVLSALLAVAEWKAPVSGEDFGTANKDTGIINI
jgi:hypothetical protein